MKTSNTSAPLPTLDLAIATWQPEGIRRVAAMLLPRAEGVRYVVSWQASQGAPIPPELTERTDVSIHRTDVEGVAANRNNALRHCTADIALNSDDDLIYTPEAFQAVRHTFAEHPELGLAAFRYEGDNPKQYPARECDLTLIPKGYWASTIELAIRLRSASPTGTSGTTPASASLRFNTAFGPGAPFTASGEDEIFLLTARRRGIACRFFPITIARHPGQSTGSRPVSDNRVLHGMGAVIRLSYGLCSLPRIVLKAWRMQRSGQCPLARALIGLFAGWRYGGGIDLMKQ